MPQKLIAFYGLLAITIPFAYLVYQGRVYRTTHDALQLEHHRDAANYALWYTALGVVLIRTATQLGPPMPYPSLFWVHLPLAVTFFCLLLVLRFWLTGLRSAQHRTLGRLCGGAFAGMLGTGAMLIWQM